MNIDKTIKLYVGSSFIRTESGRTYEFKQKGVASSKSSPRKNILNLSQASRKDFRNTVEVAHKALAAWKSRSAYNRGQIIYRMAEVLSDRKEEWVEFLKLNFKKTTLQARKEVESIIDRCVFYAGFADKYEQILSSVNPVNGRYFNYSRVQATGLVTIVVGQKTSLLKIVDTFLAAMVAQNTVILYLEKDLGVFSELFGEWLQNSDVPAGVLNVLGGLIDENLEHMASHMDVNSMACVELKSAQVSLVKDKASYHLMRVREVTKSVDALEQIRQFSELKTVWAPVAF